MPISCTQCDATFAFKIELQKHITASNHVIRIGPWGLFFWFQSRAIAAIGSPMFSWFSWFMNMNMNCHNPLCNLALFLDNISCLSLIYNYNICDKTCKHKFQLRNHMSRMHTNIKQFECWVCNIKFVSKQELKLHFVIHMPRQLQIYKFCGKQLILLLTKSQYKKHEEISF